jgi:hypothetical protein
MGNGKQIKIKSERLKEGIAILKQLRDAGVKEYSLGYLDLKAKISEWVNSENSWDGSIDFSEYGRVADVELPRYDNRAAGINFKVKKPF